MLLALTLVAVCSVFAVWQPEHEDRSWRDDVTWALRVAGLSLEEAAALLDIPRSQLSAQLALTAHWSDWRSRKLPTAFHKALYKRRLERMAKVVVLDTSELLSLVSAVRDLTDKKDVA